MRTKEIREKLIRILSELDLLIEENNKLKKQVADNDTKISKLHLEVVLIKEEIGYSEKE